MTAIARPLRDRRRSAGPVAIALLLAVAGFVLALSIGAALQSGPEPVSPASASSSENAAVGGSPAPASVREVSETTGGASQTAAVKLSTVPALPALHGVKARKPKKQAAPKRTSPAPVVRSQPRVVAPAPTVAPRRSTPVAPYRPSTPKAPVKKNPGFVGKDFDSSG